MSSEKTLCLLWSAGRNLKNGVSAERKATAIVVKLVDMIYPRQRRLLLIGPCSSVGV